jgi:glycosyltransferase involved in cell wall biosynthesis
MVSPDTGERGVAFAGTRGVPANYGGFETAVDEISRRLANQNLDCVVFCRASSRERMPKRHDGRRLIYVKGSRVRALDTFVSAIQTGWHLLRNREEYGHVFWFNNANLPGILLTLLARIPTSVNTDGLEWRRAKWSLPFKAYYFLSSFLISRLCKTLISDSKAIQSYYRRVFFKRTQFVPYGTPDVPTIAPEKRTAVLGRYGLEEDRYFLQITRFEPDNLPLETAKAFRSAGLAEDGYMLLLVGFQHETTYAKQLKALSGEEGVVVADAVYDAEVLAVLRTSCFCYVHGNSVGGTNPALLEAMMSSPRVLAIESPFSREPLGETGYFFTPDGMSASLRNVLDRPDRSAEMRDRARFYDWDKVAESYARLVKGYPADYPGDEQR